MREHYPGISIEQVYCMFHNPLYMYAFYHKPGTSKEVDLNLKFANTALVEIKRLVTDVYDEQYRYKNCVVEIDQFGFIVNTTLCGRFEGANFTGEITVTCSHPVYGKVEAKTSSVSVNIPIKCSYSTTPGKGNDVSDSGITTWFNDIRTAINRAIYQMVNLLDDVYIHPITNIHRAFEDPKPFMC